MTYVADSTAAPPLSLLLICRSPAPLPSPSLPDIGSDGMDAGRRELPAGPLPSLSRNAIPPSSLDRA